MMKTKIASAVAAMICLSACNEIATGSGANLQQAGWTLVVRSDDGRDEFYLRKADEPGDVYWEVLRTGSSEFIVQREYDCRNGRFRDVTAPLERTQGIQLSHRNKDWAPISTLIPDSAPAYIAEMVCSGRIVPYA